MWSSLCGVIGGGFFMASAIGWFGWLATHYDDSPLPIRVPVVLSVICAVLVVLTAVLESPAVSALGAALP